MRGIRLAIDALPFLVRSAGVKTYLHYWTQSLISSAGQNQVTLFPFLDGCHPLTHESSVVGRLGTASRLALLHTANYTPVPVADWLTTNCDIFHASHLLHRMPRRPRLTTTLNDMTCWLMPEVHPPARVRAAKRSAEELFRHAAAIIAISASARADALRLLPLAPEKITVIYPGIAQAFFDITRAHAQAAASRYGLMKPYVLCVGTVEPRKNLATLLDAWESLRGDLREAFDLVIVGAWGWGDKSILRRLRAGSGGVRYLGYVPETDLPSLTAAATVFVYPSLYEGFGLPLAQAMAAGVASVTSNVSSLPEVAGDAALLVDPLSPAEMGDAMERLLDSPSLRSELGERARVQARRFTWEECALRSWQLFESVAG